MLVTRVALLLTLAALCGCEGGSEKAKDKPARIFDTQRNALDKAKTVQDTVTQAAERQRQAQDEQAR